MTALLDALLWLLVSAIIFLLRIFAAAAAPFSRTNPYADDL